MDSCSSPKSCSSKSSSSSNSSSSKSCYPTMDSEEVSLPLFHEHPMIPFNDLRKGDCCGCFEAASDGYYCQICDFFIHKNCAESSKSIEHESHPGHTLRLVRRSNYYCHLCGSGSNSGLYYSCEICSFHIDLCCAKNPPPKVIDISETHHHKLTLLKKWIEFDCYAKCGNSYVHGFPYKCHECDLSFHVHCAWHPTRELKYPLEVNHSYHSSHPLNLHTQGQLPEDYDGKCRLCAREIDDSSFYHCSLCNFTVDMRCVLNPPLKSLLNFKAHDDHQLTLLPRLDSFTCNACGLKGDRSPYACFECGFMIHQDCLALPRVININRHNHRVSRTSVIGVVNSICGVCRKKMDRTCGGFSCQKCVGYVVHSKCATRKDVWNGKELEGIPEEIEDIEPYVVIDDNTIQHFSHKEHNDHKNHYLRLHLNDVLCDDNKRCKACTHHICLQSFYGCINCDFILHQNCAEFLRMKRHFVHNERLTLVTNKADWFYCGACRRICNGFRYEDGYNSFDVRCISILEPFYHPTHPDHPLFNTPDGSDLCNVCDKVRSRHVLRCIKDDCEFVICFYCITLPLVVKHRVDDHPLSLCCGEKASDKYWCDICEKETDPKKWFYTSKDHRASLHKECVVGEFSHLMPRNTIKRRNGNYEVVLNNSVSRPICSICKLRCISPIILKKFEISYEYFCSYPCWIKV